MTFWFITLIILLIIWIALLQPLWLNVRFSEAGVEVRMRYLGILLGPFSSSRREDGSEESPQRDRPKRKRSLGTWAGLFPDILKACLSALKHLFERVLIKSLWAYGRVGLSDPAVTGQGYGLFQAVVHIVPLPQSADVLLEPEFGDEIFEIEGEFEGGIRPSSVITTALVLLWHLPKLRMIRVMRS